MRDAFKRMEYRDKGFWLEGGEYVENAPLKEDIECDLAIVGGGFTGLSSAYYIKKHDPSMNIALLEAQVIGFGASGRNGGFSMPVEGSELTLHIRSMSREQAKMYTDYSQDCVYNSRKLVEEEEIDCDFEWVGLMEVARTPFQMKMLEREVKHYHELGHTDIELLDNAALKKYLNSSWHIGGRRDPVTAIINPAKMVRGLKTAVDRLGVQIFERTPVIEYHPGESIELVTPGGRVRARNMIVATNAFSMYLKIKHYRFVPMFTYIILTEPLDDKLYDELGWPGREGMVDKKLFIHYFRLTSDNRLLIGGSDAPYYFGNSVVGRDKHSRIFEQLERNMHGMFPILKDTKITHRWGGPVAITLDFVPTFGRHAEHHNILYGLGFCGHGVAQGLGAGRILRDLLLEQDTDLVKLPIVHNKLFPIPPEPFRYIFANGIRNLMRAFDAIVEIRA